MFLHKSRVILPTKGDPINSIPSSSEIEIEQNPSGVQKLCLSFWSSSTPQSLKENLFKIEDTNMLGDPTLCESTKYKQFPHLRNRN